MSDKAQNEAFKRCLQAELEGMISSINGVQSANVTISIPERDVFATEQDKPTASAIIAMQAGHTLESGKVAAITNMIAHSVPGMNAADVSVTDSNGRLLSGGGDQGSGMVGDHVAQTQAVEKEKQAQVQAMLDRILGPGNAVVNVSAELDFDQSTVKTQTYQPPTSTAISESKSKETYTGTGSGVGGVIGNGNLGNTGNGNSNYTKETETKNNVLNSTVEERTQTPGKIKRLSVAVALSGAIMAKAKPAEIDQIKQLVTAAVGADPARGDQVAVVVRNFSPVAVTPPAFWETPWFAMIVRNVVALLAVLLTLLLGVRPLIKALKRDPAPVIVKDSEEAAAARDGEDAEGYEDGEDGAESPVRRRRKKIQRIEPIIDPETGEIDPDALSRQVGVAQRIVVEQPDSALNALRQLLNEPNPEGTA
jgi:flagellar M-ring protein FliF